MTEEAKGETRVCERDLKWRVVGEGVKGREKEKKEKVDLVDGGKERVVEGGDCKESDIFGLQIKKPTSVTQNLFFIHTFNHNLAY